MIQLADARRIIAAAEKKAAEIGQPMNIAVVDEGGNLVAHVRMDNAWLGSVDIAHKKAWTSRAFDITTKDLARELAVRRPVLWNPRLQQRQGHDLRWRHSSQEGRKSCRGPSESVEAPATRITQSPRQAQPHSDLASSGSKKSGSRLWEPLFFVRSKSLLRLPATSKDRCQLLSPPATS